MKIIRSVLLITSAILFAGCSATRTLTDVGLGAGGAALGGALSKNNPAAIAGGAAGGVLLSEGLNYAAKSQASRAFLAGYNQGRSDAVKQQYWLYVDMQKQRNRRGHVRLYPLQIPEQRLDGVLFQPAIKFLRIEE